MPQNRRATSLYQLHNKCATHHQPPRVALPIPPLVVAELKLMFVCEPERVLERFKECGIHALAEWDYYLTLKLTDPERAAYIAQIAAKHGIPEKVDPPKRKAA